MPLERGNRWVYTVRSGLASQIVFAKIVEPIAIRGGSGWQVEGPVGYSRLGWQNDRLVAEELAGTRVSPPLPILFAPPHPQAAKWTGILLSGGEAVSGTANISQIEDKFVLGSRKVDAIESTVSLQTGLQTIELKTWFAERIGIVRQEQRVDGRLVRRLEHVSGP